jgi:lipopolysaccharide export system protein LptA
MLSSFSRFFLSVPIALTPLFLSSSPSLKTLDARSALPPQITIRSETQEEDPETGNVTAKGNVIFEFPEAEIRGSSEEARFIKDKQVIVLMKNVRLVQKGEQQEGDGFACVIEKKMCMPTSQLPRQAREMLGL